MTRTSLLTIRQAAERFNLPETAVRRWSKNGTLSTLHSGSRVYIRPETLEKLLNVPAEQITGTDSK